MQEKERERKYKTLSLLPNIIKKNPLKFFIVVVVVVELANESKWNNHNNNNNLEHQNDDIEFVDPIVYRTL